jgi:hypothetical protein
MRCWVCGRAAKKLDDPGTWTGPSAHLHSGPVSLNYQPTQVCLSCYLSNFGVSCYEQSCSSTAAHALGMRGRDFPDWMAFEREWLPEKYDMDTPKCVKYAYEDTEEYLRGVAVAYAED